MNLVQIYTYPSHYRTSIYKLIDQEFNADFVTSDIHSSVKRMDLTLLRHNVRVFHCVKMNRRLFYIKGLSSLIRDDYDTYIVTGEPLNISVWLLLIRKFFFHRDKHIYLWGHGALGKEGSVKRFLNRLFYGMADGGLIYNERSTKLMIDRGTPANKLHTIYNSLNYNAQIDIRKSLKPSHVYVDHFGNNYKNLIFIGRITTVKRLDLLIKAVGLLRTRGEKFNLTFVGDGVDRMRLEQLAEKLGIKEQIWFYGESYDELNNAELIYNADLCVSPGNIGLTAIHVLMFGCPAITNDDFDHQMPEFEAIHDGETGAFFHLNDSMSLADSISSWLKQHASDREKVRQACYKEIDSKWNPYNQIKILKTILNNS